MSHSPTGPRRDPGVDASTIDSDRATTVLSALGDPDCRAILEATDGEALVASELSERCDLPLSTTYRKLETLADAGLLEERTRIDRSGAHPNEYVLAVEDVVVSMESDDRMSVRVSRREGRSPAPTAPFRGLGRAD